MELHEIGLTLTTLGEVLLALLVINVHAHVAHEKKIDQDVINTIKKERYIGLVAIALIVSGYIIQIM